MKALKLLLILLMTTSLGFAQDIKIYVSDAAGFNVGPWFIFQYDEDGSNPITFIDEELGWPQDILFLPSRNEVLVSNLTTNRITKYVGSTGEYIEDFAEVAGGPTRMLLGDDGLIYLVQWSTTDNKIKRYDVEGNFVDEFTNNGVPRSVGIAWDSAGNLYGASFGGAFVQQFDANGIDQGMYVNTELQGPTNIWFDDSDNLFVIDWSSGDVEQFDASANYVGKFITGLGQPEGVDFRSNGNILIGNGTTSEVKEYLADGTFVENVVTAGSGGLTRPNAVILFDRSTLSVPENDRHTVFVTPTVGDRFTINPKLLHDFQILNIYSLNGQLMESIDLTVTDTLKAAGYAEGVYFIVAEEKGRKFTQKIVVDRN